MSLNPKHKQGKQLATKKSSRRAIFAYENESEQTAKI